jgi:hypothetical protein
MCNKTTLASLALNLVLTLAACGDSIAAEPLVGGQVLLSWDSEIMQATNGIATVSDGVPTLLVGTGAIGCGSEESVRGLTDLNMAVSVPAFVVGSYDNQVVTWYRRVDGFESHAAVGATVHISSVDNDSVSARLQFGSMEADGPSHGVTGNFTVVRCAN